MLLGFRVGDYINAFHERFRLQSNAVSMRRDFLRLHSSRELEKRWIIV